MRTWHIGALAGAVAFAIGGTASADPVSVTHVGGMALGQAGDPFNYQRGGFIDNYSVNSLRRRTGFKQHSIQYDWTTPGGSLATGSSIDLDGHGFTTALIGGTARLFAANGVTVQLVLFGGEGNELHVGEKIASPFQFQGVAGTSNVEYELSGKMNYGLVLKKNGLLLEIVKGTIDFDPSSANSEFNKIGSTDDGVAMNLAGWADWDASTCSYNLGGRNCRALRTIFFGPNGMQIALGLTGSNPNPVVIDDQGNPGGGNDGTGPIAIGETNPPGQEQGNQPPGGNGGVIGDPDAAIAVPEPAAAGLLFAALVGLASLRRRQLAS